MQWLKRIIMAKYLAVFILIIVENFANADKISNLRLCATRDCDVLISQARALARHKPTDPILLSFDRGDVINIYSKSAGTKIDLWGGEINGKRGYFPRSFVREIKVDIPNPQFTVETERYVPLEDRIMGRVPDSPKAPEADTEKHQEEPKELQQEEPKVPQQDTQNRQGTPEVEKPAVPETEKDIGMSTEHTAQEVQAKPGLDETEIAEDTELADETELPNKNKVPDREEIPEKEEANMEEPGDPEDETEIDEEDDEDDDNEDEPEVLSETDGSIDRNKLPEKQGTVGSEDRVVSENVNEQKEGVIAEEAEHVHETVKEGERKALDRDESEIKDSYQNTEPKNKGAVDEASTEVDEKAQHTEGDETELPDEVEGTDKGQGVEEHNNSDGKAETSDGEDETSVHKGDVKTEVEKEEGTKAEVKEAKADEAGGSFLGNMFSEDTEGKHSHTVAVANNNNQTSSSRIDNILAENMGDKHEHVGNPDIDAGGNNVGDNIGSGFEKSDVDLDIQENITEKFNNDTYSMAEHSRDMHMHDKNNYKAGDGFNSDKHDNEKPSVMSDGSNSVSEDIRPNSVSEDSRPNSVHKDMNSYLKHQDEAKIEKTTFDGKKLVPDDEKSVADDIDSLTNSLHEFLTDVDGDKNDDRSDSSETENLATGKKSDMLAAFREKHMKEIGGENIPLDKRSPHREAEKVQKNKHGSYNLDTVETTEESHFSKADSNMDKEASTQNGTEEMHPEESFEVDAGSQVNAKETDGATSDAISSKEVTDDNAKALLQTDESDMFPSVGLPYSSNSEDVFMTETKSYYGESLNVVSMRHEHPVLSPTKHIGIVSTPVKALAQSSETVSHVIDKSQSLLATAPTKTTTSSVTINSHDINTNDMHASMSIDSLVTHPASEKVAASEKSNDFQPTPSLKTDSHVFNDTSHENSGRKQTLESTPVLNKHFNSDDISQSKHAEETSVSALVDLSVGQAETIETYTGSISRLPIDPTPSFKTSVDPVVPTLSQTVVTTLTDQTMSDIGVNNSKDNILVPETMISSMEKQAQTLVEKSHSGNLLHDILRDEITEEELHNAKMEDKEDIHPVSERSGSPTAELQGRTSFDSLPRVDTDEQIDDTDVMQENVANDVNDKTSTHSELKTTAEVNTTSSTEVNVLPDSAERSRALLKDNILKADNSSSGNEDDIANENTNMTNHNENITDEKKTQIDVDIRTSHNAIEDSPDASNETKETEGKESIKDSPAASKTLSNETKETEGKDSIEDTPDVSKMQSNKSKETEAMEDTPEDDVDDFLEGLLYHCVARLDILTFFTCVLLESLWRFY